MFEWTNAHIDRLKELWADGLVASDIGRELGISGNAVIGKAHRLGLAPRRVVVDPKSRKIRPARVPKRVSREPSKPTQVVRAAVRKLRPLEEIRIPEPRNLDIDALVGDSCRYPVNDERGNYLFCGNEVFKPFSYCEYHARLCYLPAPPKRIRIRGHQQWV